MLLVTRFDDEVIDTLASWPQSYGIARLVVFSTRPQSLALALADRGIDANCHALSEIWDAAQYGAEKPSIPPSAESEVTDAEA